MSGHANPVLPPHVQLFVDALHTAEERAVRLLLEHPGPASGTARWPYGTLDDHRVDVAGLVADALDAMLPGLGHHLMQVLFPENEIQEGELTDAAVAQLQAWAAVHAPHLLPDAAPGAQPSTAAMQRQHLAAAMEGDAGSPVAAPSQALH
jgi:hypothetical protein